MLSSRRRGTAYRRAPLRSLATHRLEALESRVLLSGNSYTLGYYDFTGGTDGASPFGGLVGDSHGNLFGTGAAGGTANVGTFFELASGTSTPQGLYTFTDTPDGGHPYGQLTLDPHGNLFGTTLGGGANGSGSIFEIFAGATTPTVLYSFSGTDGANPYAGVTVDAAGDIFGTTVNGGTFGQGTVFEIPAGGSLITLHSFNGITDGANPYAPLLRDAVGTLYGTTFVGGSSGHGTVFQISAGTFTTLHHFTGADGAKPTARLLMDDGGNLFGTTNTGGAADDGTIFGIGASGGAFVSLYSFTGVSDGANPYADLILDSSGNMFGTTYRGGAFGLGTVFEVPFDAAAPQTLYSFTGGLDGANPYGALFRGANGSLFGTATSGGTGGKGTLFELTPTLTTQLTVAQPPTDIQAGSSINPAVVVDLELANGTVNSADSSSVTLSIISGPSGATLTGTSTVQAVHGVATFNNLKLTRAGTYTLAAADGGLDPVILGTIVVHAGPAARLAFDHAPAALVAGQTLAPVIVDVVDALGNVTTDNSMVTLSLVSKPPGALLTGTLSQQAVSGVATFSDLSVTTAGTCTLAAADGNFPALKSAPFSVTPELASAQLVITHQPGNTIVGKAISPGLTVTLEDRFGNLIASNTTQVTASLVVLNLGGNATSATLAGAATAITKKGVATLANIAISQPGNFELQFSSTGLAAVTTTPLLSFFVPTHLVFTQQPVPTTAGSSIGILVKIEDASGRVDITSSSLVTLSLKGNGTLSGTLSVPAINGVATFSDLSLAKAGTYTLSAASGSLTAAKSASFRIVADPATAHLVVGSLPATPSVVGKPLAPNLVVQIQDQFGNLLTTDHSSATITIASGPSAGTLTGLTTVTAAGGVLTFKNLALAQAGAYSLQITDAALALATPLLVSQTITPGVTSLSGVPATTSRTFGQAISLSANFKSTAPGAVPFTGIASLVDASSHLLGTVALTAAGQARFNVVGLAPGTYLCNLLYPGDANHTSVTSSTFTLQVALASTTTTLATSTATPVFGQSLTLTASVHSASAPGVLCTGSVSFYDGLTLLGTAALDSTSTAQLTFTPAAAGHHAYKAVYSGDVNFKTSASPTLSRTVAKDRTSIVLSPSLASPIAHNQTFNLTVHVAVLAPGVSMLTGNLVTLKDNGKIVTTLNLDGNGDASLVGLSYSAPGSHTLSAIYAGDADTLAATSAPLKLTIV